jgi:hypothetical protein
MALLWSFGFRSAMAISISVRRNCTDKLKARKWLFRALVLNTGVTYVAGGFSKSV